MAMGDMIGKSIKFEDWRGDTRTGTVVSILRNGDYEVSTDRGMALVKNAEIVKMRRGGGVPKATQMKRAKVEKVMHEFKEGKLRSGSKRGPVVKDRDQAIAIALSEAGMSKKMGSGGKNDFSIVVIKPLNTRVGSKVLNWFKKNNVKINFDGEHDWHTKGYGEEIWFEDEENIKNSYVIYIFDLKDFSNRKELEKGLDELENQNEGKIQISYLDEVPDWIYESYENDKMAQGGSTSNKEKMGKITISDIVSGARFKTKSGTVFIVDEVKGDTVHSSFEGGEKGNYRDTIDEFVDFMNEMETTRVMATGGSVDKDILKVGGNWNPKQIANISKIAKKVNAIDFMDYSTGGGFESLALMLPNKTVLNFDSEDGLQASKITYENLNDDFYNDEDYENYGWIPDVSISENFSNVDAIVKAINTPEKWVFAYAHGGSMYKDGGGVDEEFKTDMTEIIAALNKCEAGEFDLFGEDKILHIYTKPTIKKLSIHMGVLSKYAINFLTRTINKRDILSNGNVSIVQKERTFSTVYGSKIQVTTEQNQDFKDAVGNLLKKSIKYFKLNISNNGQMAQGGSMYAGGGGLGESKEYKVGDEINETLNSKWEESWQLFKPRTSYVLDNNKVISIHKTPDEAIENREILSKKLNKPNLKVYWKPFPELKEHIKEIMASKMAQGGSMYAGGGALEQGAINYLGDLWFAIQERRSDEYANLSTNLDRLHVPFSIQNAVSSDAEAMRGRKAISTEEAQQRIRKILADNGINKFNKGGSMDKEVILWAVKKGDPDWAEVVITNNPNVIENAKKWASENGYDRLRVSGIDMSDKPDFTKTFAQGGVITKSDVSKMQKINIRGFEAYMPGIRTIYFDQNSEKFFYPFDESEFFELKNDYTLGKLNSFLKEKNITLKSKMATGGYTWKHKMAKGGLTEHGLKVGDKILLDGKKYGVPDAAQVLDSKNKRHLVNLNKGERGKAFAQGGGVEKGKRGGVMGDIYSVGDKEQFKQIITVYNELSEKFGVVNYFIDHNDNSVVFLMESHKNNKTMDLNRYVNSLQQRGFNVFDKTQDISIKKDNGENEKYYFKLKLSKNVEMVKKMAQGGNIKVGDKFYSYENPDTAYGVTYIYGSGADAKYKLSLRDKDGYSYSSKYIDAKSLSKTSRKSDAAKVKNGKMTKEAFKEKWGSESYLDKYAGGGYAGWKHKMSKGAKLKVEEQYHPSKYLTKEQWEKWTEYVKTGKIDGKKENNMFAVARWVGASVSNINGYEIEQRANKLK